MNHQTETTVRELDLADLARVSGAGIIIHDRGHGLVGPEYAGMRGVIGPEIAGIRGAIGPEI